MTARNTKERRVFSKPEARIACFSMEIAAGPGLPTFGGGLGVFAGGSLRFAADLMVVRSGSSNEPQRLQIFRSVGAVLD
jgi:glucan phosphorylase